MVNFRRLRKSTIIQRSLQTDDAQTCWQQGMRMAEVVLGSGLAGVRFQVSEGGRRGARPSRDAGARN